MDLVTIREELAPLLDELDGALRADGDPEARSFFDGFREAVFAAASTDELQPAFLELSTAAFRGFVFGPESVERVDRLLARAQTIAFRLANRGGLLH